MKNGDFNSRRMRVSSAPPSLRDDKKVISNQPRPLSGQTMGSVPPQKKTSNYNNHLKTPSTPLTKNPYSCNDPLKMIKNSQIPLKQGLKLKNDNNFGKFGVQDKKVFVKANNDTRESYSKEERIPQDKQIINNQKSTKLEENKIKNQINSKKCNSCNKSSNQVFKTTKCTSHTYCIICIKKEGMNSCFNCKNYFENLLKSNCSKNLCFICKDVSLSPHFKCKSHSYCLTCSEFLAKNNFIYIDKVFKCQECRKIFQNNSLQKVTTSEKNIEPFSQPNDYSPETTDIKALEYANGVNLKEFSPVSNFGMNADKFECCRNNSGKKFKTPRCLDHEYCDHCIVHGSRYVKCEVCIIYFESINRQKNSNTYQCSLCKIAPTDSPIKCRFHQYCGYCYDFLKNNDYDHIVNVVNCEDCNRCLKAIKNEALQKLIQRSQQNSIKNNEINQNICFKSGTNTDVASKMCYQKFCSAENENLFKTSICREHEYCINCIKNEKTQNECPNCMKYFKFLHKKMLHQKNFCCLCNDPAIESNDKCEVHSYCKICNEFLENNDFSHIDLVSKCRDCTAKFKNSNFNEAKGLIVQEEEIQGKKIKLFKTPRCDQHEFCIECINCDINIKKTKINCYECKNYFLGLRKTYKLSNSLCSLCYTSGFVPNDECKLHRYCTICTKLLQDNNPIYFNIVTECHECNAYFKKNINSEEEKKKLSNVEFNQELKKIPEKDIKNAGSNTNLNKSSEESLPKQIDEKKIQGPILKNLDTQEQNELNNTIKQEHPNPITNKSSTCSELNQTFICSGCNSKKSKVFKTPRCTAHNLCEVCINKQSNSLKCDYCSMYFESLIKKKDQNVFKCSLCKLPPYSPNIKCKSHSYCKNCYEFLINNDFLHIITVANCENCCNSFKIIKEKEEIVEKPYIETQSIDSSTSIVSQNCEDCCISLKIIKEKEESVEKPYIETQSIDNSTSIVSQDSNSHTVNLNEDSKCSFCQGKNNLRAFLCNHKICIVCLVKMCCVQLHDFVIKHIDHKFNKYYKFGYFCTFNGCMKRISVPTKMVIIFLNRFLNDDSLINDFLDYNYIATPGNLDKWIGYLDGIALN